MNNKRYIEKFLLTNAKIDESRIVEARDRINWDDLSKNTNIEWINIPAEILTEYANWNLLSANIGFKINEVRLGSYVEKIEWPEYSNNTAAFINTNTLETYKEYWDWYYISQRNDIKWTDEKIKKYSKYIVWQGVSRSSNLNINMETLIDYIEKWDWKAIAGNMNFTWTLDDFDIIYSAAQNRCSKDLINEICSAIGGSLNFQNPKQLLKHEYKFLATDQFCENHLIFWSTEELKLYKDEIAWDGILKNKNITWDVDKIINFYDHIDFDLLSGLQNVSWSIEFIRKFKGELNWMRLSENESLPWSEDLLFEFQNQWRWGKYDPTERFFSHAIRGLVNNKKIVWTTNILEKFSEKINWDALSGAGSITESALSSVAIQIKLNYELLSRNDNVQWSNLVFDVLKERVDSFMIANKLNNIPLYIANELLNNWHLVKDEEGVLGLDVYERDVFNKHWPEIFHFKNEHLIALQFFKPASLGGLPFIGNDVMDIQTYNKIIFHDKEFINKIIEGMIDDRLPDNVLNFAKHKEILCAIVESSYSFSSGQLRSMKALLDWKYVSKNRFINWSEDLVDEFSQFIVWDEFLSHACEQRFCDEFFLYKYKKYINWDLALRIQKFPWCKKLLEAALDSNACDKSLLSRKSGWDIYLVKEHADNVDFDALCSNSYFDWDEAAINEFLPKINWLNLSTNISLSVSLDFLLLFANRWDIASLKGHPGLPWKKRGPSYFIDELHLECDEYDFDEFTDQNYARQRDSEVIAIEDIIIQLNTGSQINWIDVSAYSDIGRNYSFLKKYKNEIIWSELCKNKKLEISPDFVNLFRDNIHWVNLVENPNCTVTLDWLERNFGNFELVKFLPSNIENIFHLNRSPAILLHEGALFNLVFEK